jgi:hypothetical protein
MANPENLKHFKPGQSGNPRGLPRGSRHRLSECVLAELCETWETHGKDALNRLAAENPVAFVRIVASLVPRQREALVNPFDDFTDEDLDQLAAYLESIRDEAAETAH